MADCIERACAIAIVDNAAELHPYSKDRSNPETYSEFNNGWESACDYILSHIETAKPADVAEVRHGRWTKKKGGFWEVAQCSECGEWQPTTGVSGKRCNDCGAKMDLEDE